MRKRRDWDQEQEREQVRNCPPWLAELWQLGGRDPPDPHEDLADLARCLAEVRARLADLDRRLQA